MPVNLTESSLRALQPIFKPWEEPTQHRIKNPNKGEAALIKGGRRPSNSTPVRAIRAEVDAWRSAGYPGVTPTTETLLIHWFFTEHLLVDDNGGQYEFHYYWPQREAIETIIYLYEVKKINNVGSLIGEFYGDHADQLMTRIQPEDDRWPKDCCKIATGGGKTKVMSLAVVWCFFNSLYEPDSSLARHFVLIAPNLTVYERLKDDFENCKIFSIDPLIPEEWKGEFQVQTVLQDQAGGNTTLGTIYLTNIHRLYPKKEEEQTQAPNHSLLGPDVSRAQALRTGEALRMRIASHPSMMILNDEAHHLHDPELKWNVALDTLHSQSLSRGNRGICLQVDFTATPKHNDGSLFEHIVCDYPLGEAVDSGIVKVPVIGESDQLRELGDTRTPAHQRYAMHLRLGYERYKLTYEEYEKVRKPILFVMTEDAQAANEISSYLDNDMFPLLKGRVLNLHIRLKGKVKKVKRGGKEYKEFVESETGISDDDLKELRKWSRDLDKKESPYRCVVSVMMLREGWDIRNVTTIVPLRPYSAAANILPEQTLGRGLRRMFPNADVPEIVTVVHHPAFKDLYEKELEQEGFDIVVTPLSERIRQTATIFVDYQNKPVNDLEIELPIVTDAVETSAELKDLGFDEVNAYFRSKFPQLSIGKRRDERVEYRESTLFTEEIINRMMLDVGLLSKTYSAISYFTQELGRACHLNNAHQALHPLLEKFISETLFERKVDIYSGEVDHRMADPDVREFIRATFTPLILEKIVQKKSRRLATSTTKLSAWQPYQVSSTERSPAVEGQRTMFNLVPCESELESEFADLCDTLDDVASFAKNAGPQKLMIDYIRPDGPRALYVPDFFVRSTGGMNYLVELKGNPDKLVPIKARAAQEWCASASKANLKWEYLYIPFHIIQQGGLQSIEQLAAACKPSLIALVEEAKSGQLALPLEEAKTKKDFDQFLQEIFKDAGVTSLSKEIDQQVIESVDALFYSIRTEKKSLSGAFLNLLAITEMYAIKILDCNLRPHIPQFEPDLSEYFNPFVQDEPGLDKNLLITTQRRLKNNLIYGRNSFRMGCLLFCIRYAQEGFGQKTGLWKDISIEFQPSEFKQLFDQLNQVNDFRNASVHGDEILSNPDAAKMMMSLVVSCLSEMVKMSR